MKTRKLLLVVFCLQLGLFIAPMIERAQATPVTFTITLPDATTYYTQGLDVRATNSTNNVQWARMRYNNGSWSSNYTMTWDAGNSWWEYETAATFWLATDDYQVQVIFNSTDAEQADQSVSMTIDTTPTFTISHPQSRAYTDNRVAIEYSVPGSASEPWNIWDGSAWVYSSNQTGEVASGLDWDTSYTLYAYAVDGVGTSVVDSSRAFSVGSKQGAAGPRPETPAEPTPVIAIPIEGFIKWIKTNMLLSVILIGGGLFLYNRHRKQKG